MKYLSKEPIVFGMAKGQKFVAKDCDHKGTRKVYVHSVWECERCGAKLSQ